VNGTTTSFAPGATLSVPIALTAGSITDALDVTVTIDSPAGDAVLMTTSSEVTATATPSNLVASSAQVRVQNRQITATQVQLDVGNIDSAVPDHLKGGSLIFSISNPFAVPGTLALTIAAGKQTVI